LRSRNSRWAGVRCSSPRTVSQLGSASEAARTSASPAPRRRIHAIGTTQSPLVRTFNVYHGRALSVPYQIGKQRLLGHVRAAAELSSLLDGALVEAAEEPAAAVLVLVLEHGKRLVEQRVLDGRQVGEQPGEAVEGDA